VRPSARSLGETQQVLDVGKNSCVAGNAAEDKTVLVLHFALDNPSAKDLVVLGRRDRGPRLPGRTKARGFEGERRKDFAGAESIERFAAENLDDFPEQE